VVVATNNPHKFTEIQTILGQALPNVTFIPISELGDFPEPDENGETFTDNALIKAHAAVGKTGLPASRRRLRPHRGRPPRRARRALRPLGRRARQRRRRTTRSS